MINNPKIGIINHNFANLHSVKKALDYLNCPNIITNKPKCILKYIIFTSLLIVLFDLL